MDEIKVVGARIHNLKNINVNIPKGKMILVQDGNSVIIIEHDPEILSYCDYIIELGPDGGPKGGEIIAKGTPEEVKKSKTSKTAPYLN